MPSERDEASEPTRYPPVGQLHRKSKPKPTGPKEIYRLTLLLLAVATSPCWLAVIGFIVAVIWCMITGEPFIPP